MGSLPKRWCLVAPLALGLACGLAGAFAPGLHAAMLTEDFSADPMQRGWVAVGDGSLFRWDPLAGALRVTWDSSRTNSFMRLPLGTILTQADDFAFSFELSLEDIRIGTTPDKPREFEIAVGLIHARSASATNAFRGAGQSSLYGVRNLVEWDFFPDGGFGDTWATTVVSTNNRILPAHNFPLALDPGSTFRITLSYTATNQLLRTAATRDGVPYGLPPSQTLADLDLTGQPDFRVDSFAVISYSDAGQFGPLSLQGSVLAHGTVDNVELRLPPAPVQALQLRQANGLWRAEFLATLRWVYVLERSEDLAHWRAASRPATAETSGQTIALADTNAPAADGAYYRVRAEKP